MSISKIEINNLLSFDNIIINDFKEINCLVGINNAGKSNFLKLIQFFYAKLHNKKVIAPGLNNNYAEFGTITITYNLKFIRNIVTKIRNTEKSDIFPIIFKTFFSDDSFLTFITNLSDKSIHSQTNKIEDYKLTLYINKNESVEWSTKDKQILKFIKYLYPFFYINTRSLDLHNWEYIWEMVSHIKTYKTRKVSQNDFLSFINEQISKDTKNINTKYSNDITTIKNIIKKYDLDLNNYSYNEKIINLIRTGLDGHTFNFNGEELSFQSDGTKSSSYLQIFISLMLILSRREYIIPTLYIDEPEIGLHPKKAEELIFNIFDIYQELGISSSKKQFPHLLFSTHSPNILKIIIKLFENKQQVLHFSKKQTTLKNLQLTNTKVSKLKSTYKDSRFLNRFTDNEARLFFSRFILFVEGETELELFGHNTLTRYFPILKKIDIYQTADLTKIKNINPSYSNTNIPYYILYDLDKIIRDNINNKYTLYNDNFNFKKKYEESLKKFPEKIDSKIKIPLETTLLKYLTNNFKMSFDCLINNDLFIKSFKNDKLIIGKYHWKKNDYKIYLDILKEYLKNENILIANTTIENLIVNKRSIKFFINWLIYELEENVKLKYYYNYKDDYKEINKKDALKKYTNEVKFFYSNYCKIKNTNRIQLSNYFKIKKILSIHKIKYFAYEKLQKNPYDNVDIIFPNFFEYNNSNIYHKNELHRFYLNYLNKMKYHYINKIKNTIWEIKKILPEQELAYLFLILFNGKSESLKNKKIFKNQKNTLFSKYLNQLEKEFKILEHFYGKKTSNWVSSFLNYYFEYKELTYKESKESEKNIKNDFKNDFKDLYDMIDSINLKLVE